jgi:hypothetical protein
MFLRFHTLSSAEAWLLYSGRNTVHRNHVGHMWRCRHVVCSESADEMLLTAFNRSQFLGNNFNYTSALLSGSSWKIY